jgi:hypothetical protein
LQNAHRAVARLDLPGEIKGLNVSNAPVLALYVGATRLGLMGRRTLGCAGASAAIKGTLTIIIPA